MTARFAGSVVSAFALLPTFACAQPVVAAAPAWLPETAAIEFPGAEPVFVTFLADVRIGLPIPAFAEFDLTLRAARGGDGEAAYLLYKSATLCGMLRREEASGTAAAGTAEGKRFAAFCERMPVDTRELSRLWLHEAARAHHPEAILDWSMWVARDERRAMLERLWYRGHVLALGQLAKGERGWTRLSSESPRTMLVRSMGYEWLHARVCEAAYGAASEHRSALEQVTRNLGARWASLDEEEQRTALLNARSLLLESRQCCTIPVSGPRIVF